MNRGIDNNYQSFTRANHLKNGEEEIHIKESNFLPSMELIKWSDCPDIDLILEEDGLNMLELKTYLDPTVIVAY